jgi:hypothetical protein
MSWSQTRLHYSSLRLQIKANAPSLLCSILLSKPAEKPHQTRLAAAETLCPRHDGARGTHRRPCRQLPLLIPILT